MAPLDSLTLTRQILGHSVENRAIECYRFSHVSPQASTAAVSGPGSNFAGIDTLFLGVFHGDEAISGQLLERFCQFLQEHPDSLPTGRSIAVVPSVNPDGLTKETRINARKVDLNRNYPTLDWCEENPDTPYYSGTAPASEPETQLVLGLLVDSPPLKIISIHAPYRVINYDGPALALAQAMAACNGYPVVDSIGYPTPGSFGTYVGKERNIPTITLELPEDEPLDTVWADNREALLAAIRFQV